MAEPAQSLYAMVELVDHQMIDRSGAMAGKVDDAEIRIDADGVGWLDALLTGPGILATRTGHTTYGRWREDVEAKLDAGEDRRSRIPMSQVAELAATVKLALDAEQLASHGTERWVNRHIIGHIPGAGRG
ncbi:MAG: hypothetical protein ACXWCM_01595 [Acidimicrobiales bacterium]